MRRGELAMLVMLVLSLVASICFYPQMPERMASHWNAQGEVDGYLPRLLGLLLMPSVLGGLSLLFIAIPRIDPMKANIEEFRGYYDAFAILVLAIMLSVHLQMLLWNAGVKISPNLILPIGFGVMFYCAGILCENARRNWFIGIRTPWTLSSERVWNKTHRVGGRLFKIAGLIALAGVLLQNYVVLLILVPMVLAVAYTVAYSYVEWQRESQRER